MDVKKTIWDPLRKKEVALTPEERVRQWCIGVLAGQMQVPMHLMMSEAGFKLGGKQFRADIIVYDRKVQPLLVVECKRPEVELTKEVLDQALRYNMVLDVRYMIMPGRSSLSTDLTATHQACLYLQRTRKPRPLCRKIGTKR